MLVTPIFNGDDLAHEFRVFNRGDQFSREGFDALHEYHAELSEDIGEDIQIDVIAICCEWSEYDSMRAAIDAYGDEITCLDDLRDRTAAVIVLPSGGVLMTDF